MKQTIKHARALGPDERPFWLDRALVAGPRPAGEALATLDAFFTEQPVWSVLGERAHLLAMLGRFDEARELVRTLSERQRGLDEVALNATVYHIAELAGDYQSAAAALSELCVQMQGSGQTARLSTVAPKLGRVLCALGRHDEAEPLARQGRDLGDPSDIVTQAHWRRVQALVHAHRGEHTEAERLAREAVAYAGRTDALELQGETLADLAEVLEAAGRRDEAIEAWHEALDRYERKQIIPLARRVRRRPRPRLGDALRGHS